VPTWLSGHSRVAKEGQEMTTSSNMIAGPLAMRFFPFAEDCHRRIAAGAGSEAFALCEFQKV